MSFIENVTCFFCGEKEIVPYDFRYQVFGSRGGYFEGVQGIVGYNDKEVLFAVKSGKISVEGKDLKIEKLYDKDVAVSGKIIKVEKLQ